MFTKKVQYIQLQLIIICYYRPLITLHSTNVVLSLPNSLILEPSSNTTDNTKHAAWLDYEILATDTLFK